MKIVRSLLLAAGLALAAVSGTAQTLTPLEFSLPIRFDYVPPGAGDKPLLASDLDGPYVKSSPLAGSLLSRPHRTPRLPFRSPVPEARRMAWCRQPTTAYPAGR